MRAIQVVEHGAPVALRDIAAPEPGPGEVRIAVRACGLNFGDLLLISGRYQERPALPFTLGMEFAGTVDAVGPGVKAFAPGDRVAAYTGLGGLAELAIAPADLCVKLPDSMSFIQAAAFLVAYGTSHVALDHRARLAPGERLLVLGAAGGVGLTAVELGRLMGAEVIACARGAARLEICRKAGAHHLIDNEAGNLRDAVKALGGADVVYDPVGGELFDQALRATNPEGRILPLGFASGTVPQIPANIILVKNISVLGYYWGGYVKFAPHVLTDSYRQLLAWFTEGRLAPHVGATFPLERTAEGLEALRNRAVTGKMVITID